MATGYFRLGIGYRDSLAYVERTFRVEPHNSEIISTQHTVLDVKCGDDILFIDPYKYKIKSNYSKNKQNWSCLKKDLSQLSQSSENRS